MGLTVLIQPSLDYLYTVKVAAIRVLDGGYEEGRLLLIRVPGPTLPEGY